MPAEYAEEWSNGMSLRRGKQQAFVHAATVGFVPTSAKMQTNLAGSDGPDSPATLQTMRVAKSIAMDWKGQLVSPDQETRAKPASRGDKPAVEAAHSLVVEIFLWGGGRVYESGEH